MAIGGGDPSEESPPLIAVVEAAVPAHPLDLSADVLVDGHPSAAVPPPRAVRLPRILAAVRDRLREHAEDPEQAILPLLLVLAFFARVAYLPSPNAMVFDEAYYVNASRVILGIHVADGAAYAGAPAGLDPNTEHPPLGKVLIAASMGVFGDNGIGWRLPSLVAGMLALWALYRLVRGAGGSAWLGIAAMALFAMDNLALVHARIGTLDMMVLAPILLGAWAGVRRRWTLAGVLTGVGMLVKLTAVYGLVALLLHQAYRLVVRWRTDRRIGLADLRPTALILAGYLVVTGAGLWALDARFSSYTDPVAHLTHMVEYGASLKNGGRPPSSCASNDSAPWQWLVNDCEMDYYRTAVDVRSEGKLISSDALLDFRGAMNPVLLGGMWLAVPFAIWSAWRRRDRVAGWAIAWMAANYVPYLALATVGQRITYLYYFLPVVPGLAVAIAILLLRSGLPRVVAWGYMAAYFVAFLAYYPIRQFPPG